MCYHGLLSLEDQSVIRVKSGREGSRKQDSRSISSMSSQDSSSAKKVQGRGEHIRRKEGIHSSTVRYLVFVYSEADTDEVSTLCLVSGLPGSRPWQLYHLECPNLHGNV